MEREKLRKGKKEKKLVSLACAHLEACLVISTNSIIDKRACGTTEKEK